MDMNDILARLKNGETADDIAKNLTEMLNTANKQYEEEKAKALAEEKAKAEVAKKEKQKLEDFCLLFAEVKDFLHQHYGYEYAELDMISAKDVLAAIDTYADLSDWTISFANKIGNNPIVKTTIKKPIGEVKQATKNVANTVDDIITKFLKEMNW